ncbi:MAG: hypothetical protein HQL73_09535 [Magnetococcales bacterium]|nr:hypothetical protein [Magnetococcales bacterium]
MTGIRVDVVFSSIVEQGNLPTTRCQDGGSGVSMTIDKMIFISNYHFWRSMSHFKLTSRSTGLFVLLLSYMAVIHPVHGAGDATLAQTPPAGPTDIPDRFQFRGNDWASPVIGGNVSAPRPEEPLLADKPYRSPLENWPSSNADARFLITESIRGFVVNHDRVYHDKPSLPYRTED